MTIEAFKLCYVEDGRAYFTTQDINQQWGDDWDDAPYEHNAGTPYEPTVYHYGNGSRKLSPRDWMPNGVPKWQLLELRFSSQEDEILEPRAGHFNSPYSVKEINAGSIPWLRAQRWNRDEKDYEITGELMAGASVADFISFIEQFNGVVWVPHKGMESLISPKAQNEFVMADER